MADHPDADRAGGSGRPGPRGARVDDGSEPRGGVVRPRPPPRPAPGGGGPARPGPRVARFDDVSEPGAGADHDRVADLGAVGGGAAAPAADRAEGDGYRVAGLDTLAARAPAAPVVPVDALRSDRRDAGPVAGFDAPEVGAAAASGRTADLTTSATGARRAGARGRPGAPETRERRAPGRADPPDEAGSRPAAPRRSSSRPAPDRAVPEPAPHDRPAPDGHGSDDDPEPRGARRPGRRSGRSDGAGRGRAAAPDPDADPVALAREICLRLLTDRARTRHELAQALRREGVPDDAAEQVLGRFDEVGLIDDTAFAGQWVRSRHRYRGLGRRAIAAELRRKGVDDEIAGEALAEVDGEAEEQRARQLVDKKLRTMTLAGPDDRTAAIRRLVGMLARKGYGAGVAYGVVRAAMAEHGADEEFGDEPPPED
ncbi:regulatory protein RecX [Pseudonocardia humida]|uniref:Regulatory protein RecX n=1 Tax=Pseudonocardia humida TaxID=2800819 RepID=A0ABT1ACR5_9PSEU|nr:regulatory protein RecX [Pseudonocardia humida]